MSAWLCVRGRVGEEGRESKVEAHAEYGDKAGRRKGDREAGSKGDCRDRTTRRRQRQHEAERTETRQAREGDRGEGSQGVLSPGRVCRVPRRA